MDKQEKGLMHVETKQHTKPFQSCLTQKGGHGLFRCVWIFVLGYFPWTLVRSLFPVIPVSVFGGFFFPDVLFLVGHQLPFFAHLLGNLGSENL